MFRNKKYWRLLPPFLVISIILAIWLPPKLKPIAVFVILVFWAVYYLWVHFEKTNNSRK